LVEDFWNIDKYRNLNLSAIHRAINPVETAIGRPPDYGTSKNASKIFIAHFQLRVYIDWGNMREDRKGVDSKKIMTGIKGKSTASINHACIITP
jgi:hypothetical protein